LELHDLIATAEGARDAHGEGVRLGAGRNEAHLLGARNRIDKLGGEPDAIFVVGEKSKATIKLLAHRLDDLRMTVADEHRAGAEQKIDVFAAFDVGDAAGVALA